MVNTRDFFRQEGFSKKRTTGKEKIQSIYSGFKIDESIVTHTHVDTYTQRVHLCEKDVEFTVKRR